MRPHQLLMATLLALVLAIAWVAGLAAQETTAPAPADTGGLVGGDSSSTETIITIRSGFPVGLYKIESLYIEPSGKSLDSNITITGKKMTQLAISPATLSLPNGDYSLNIGSGEDFNHMIVLKATGQSREIIVHGDATLSRVSGLATIVLGLAAFICSPNTAALFNAPGSAASVDALGIAGLVCGGLAIGGAVAWGVSAPWVEVK